MSQPWDGGQPVSAKGRYYVQCAAGVATVLQERQGAAGDDLDWLWLYPADTSPGLAQLADDTTVLWTWPAGIVLTDTRPIFVPLNLRSREGAWTLTLPADMAAMAAGAFQ